MGKYDQTRVNHTNIFHSPTMMVLLRCFTWCKEASSSFIPQPVYSKFRQKQRQSAGVRFTGVAGHLSELVMQSCWKCKNNVKKYL